jgi:hypothetical protein
MTYLIIRMLFHYYVALKLSAAAVGPLGVTWIYDTPAPIVRHYARGEEPRWHPVEMLQEGSRTAILTIPVSAADPTAAKAFMLN